MADACIGRVSLKRARELLAVQGDAVEQSTLSRYVAKYADALNPEKSGRETMVDFEALLAHRQANIHRDAPASRREEAPARGRADEAALNIRAQRQMRELELAERIGALTPVREVEDAAAASVSAMRTALALALNDTASALGAACGVEPRLVRPHLKQFERAGLDAFVRELAARGLAEAA